LGSRAIDGLDLRGRARPYLDRLQDKFGETVFFCILDEGQVFYVEKVESQRSVRTACTVGSRAPAYCTAVGKAMLAELPDAEVNKIIHRWKLKPVTRNTITTASALKDELKAARTRGYAIDDEEKEEGLRCVGAAVRSHSGKLAAAMSVSGPAAKQLCGQRTSCQRNWGMKVGRSKLCVRQRGSLACAASPAKAGPFSGLNRSETLSRNAVRMGLRCRA